MLKEYQIRKLFCRKLFLKKLNYWGGKWRKLFNYVWFFEILWEDVKEKKTIKKIKQKSKNRFEANKLFLYFFLKNFFYIFQQLIKHKRN